MVFDSDPDDSDKKEEDDYSVDSVISERSRRGVRNIDKDDDESYCSVDSVRCERGRRQERNIDEDNDEDENSVEQPNKRQRILKIPDKRVSLGGIVLTMDRIIEAPIRAERGRRRVIAVNTSAHVKSSCTNPSKKHKEEIRIRLEANPGADFVSKKEGLVLWCNCCDKAISSKASSFKDHLKSKLHSSNKKRKAEIVKEDIKKAQDIKALFLKSRQTGETLDPLLWVYRLDFLSAVMASGVPKSSLDGLRDTIEKYSGMTMTNTSKLSEFIPKMLELEETKLVKEIQTNFLTVIFDGSSAEDEVFCVVFRWTTPELKIITRLADMKLYVGSFNTDKLVYAVNSVLRDCNVSDKMAGHTTDQFKQRSQVLSWMRDRCAVNKSGVNVLQELYPKSIDSECLSHIDTLWRALSIDRTGEIQASIVSIHEQKSQRVFLLPLCGWCFFQETWRNSLVEHV